MSLLNGFNANDVEDKDFGGSFVPLPEGVYTVLIDKTEERVNSKKTGSMLVCEFVVLDEEYRNRRLWAYLNLDNPSAASVASARAELAQICKAIGVPAPRSHEELCNKPLLVELKVKINKDTKEPTNRAIAYAAVGSAPTGPGQTLGEAKGTAAPTRAAAPAAAPWKKA